MANDTKAEFLVITGVLPLSCVAGHTEARVKFVKIADLYFPRPVCIMRGTFRRKDEA